MKPLFKTITIALILIISNKNYSFAWGFYAHKKINRIAIFSLPKEMFVFYKKHIDYITDKATNPDKRRYILKNEAPKHYIDLEDFGDSALFKLPHHYLKIKNLYSEDSLQKLGTVPWQIQAVCYQLTEAFKTRNQASILKLSADLGHYIGDANVPLHSTKNYNGQLTNQVGIHGFWESRLPELFSEQYDLFVGNASYIENVADYSWNMITKANNALDSVLRFESQLNAQFPSDKKYSFEERGSQTIKVYSKKYATAYHEMLAGQVERQLKASIKSTADLWYTCWINAGQPDLSTLIDDLQENENEENKEKIQDTEIRPETHIFSEELNSCAHHHNCCETESEYLINNPKKWFVFWK